MTLGPEGLQFNVKTKKADPQERKDDVKEADVGVNAPGNFLEIDNRLGEGHQDGDDGNINEGIW